MSGKPGAAVLAPGLYFVATPIGNARDITLRALDVLGAAEVLAAEDTRSLRRLMEIHGVPLAGRKVLAYHDHSSPGDRARLVGLLREGRSVAYVSEAGSPLVADPGFALGREAIAEGVSVFPVPGPVAAIAALTASGLPSDRFTFAGFPPAASSARKRFLRDLAVAPGTLILYESPKRLAACLGDAAGVLGGERPAAVCRELTKKFEEVRRGTLAGLAAEIGEGAVRGEIVLLIGEGAAEPPAEADVEAALRAELETSKLKDAARIVAERLGVPKRDVYQLGLKLGGR